MDKFKLKKRKEHIKKKKKVYIYIYIFYFPSHQMTQIHKLHMMIGFELVQLEGFKQSKESPKLVKLISKAWSKAFKDCPIVQDVFAIKAKIQDNDWFLAIKETFIPYSTNLVSCVGWVVFCLVKRLPCI